MFKTEPYSHQLKEYNENRDTEVRGVLWEQGTGKTKLLIDKISYLFLQKKINGVLIIAPGGVERNWVRDEIPTHMLDEVLDNTFSHIYQTKKSKTKWHSRACEKLLTTHHNKLAILAMSYDSIMTSNGASIAKQFLTSRNCLYILDESTRIKSPRAKRTIRILASSKYAKYKTILTGTPITNSPFDIYSQIKFLDSTFWGRNGFGSYHAFKTTFGVWQTGYNKQKDKEYQYCVAYQRLDLLKEMIRPIVTRVKKEDVLDLPPKVYTKRYFELTGEQRKIYTELKDEFMTELQTGELLTAPLAIVRLLRLQQVICGYLPQEDGSKQLDPVPGKNPRLELLREICEDLTESTIIWARFNKDRQLIMEMLGDKAALYDGSVSDDDREIVKNKFQNGEIQFFVANPQVAGEGLTLHKAKTVIYYSNNFKLSERLQSEDRAHRIGQTQSVTYIDLIAEDTVDEHIVNSLVRKLEIASIIIGDKLKEWL